MNLDELQHAAAAEQLRQAKMRHVRVCTGSGCTALHSEAIIDALQSELVKQDLHKTCHIKPVGCRGLCASGPMVNVSKSEGDEAAVLYRHVTLGDAPEIIRSLESSAVERLRFPTEQPFFTRQKKIVLEHCGEIDPEHIEDAIAHGGYRALLRALTELTPAQVVEQITQSGLRGRGGAGFPTGVKWATVAKSPGDKKYVVCNGDEGDPGAFMDRSVMEGDPHRVIEGMIIAGYAVGANQGFVYVRAEYPLAVKRLKMAIRHASRLGFLGKNVCGTGFEFDIEVRLGAGAFVCGEETALMTSVEGNRGTPRPRPPFPAESGLWGQPTLINNVETFANIAPIIKHGPAWFSAIGTPTSAGTKVFALVGQIANAGLIEVPMGVTLREIIFEIGGGIPDGRAFKAVQTGGPSGGCIPAQFLDMPVDYESLKQIGTIMGSGGMIVMDDSTSMVDIARYYMEFCMDESCGKCVPCRVGTAQMHLLLTRFAESRASAADLAKLESLCDLVKNTSLCGLGQTAPNPVLSTLRYFRNEYEARVTPASSAGQLAGSVDPA